MDFNLTTDQKQIYALTFWEVCILYWEMTSMQLDIKSKESKLKWICMATNNFIDLKCVVEK